MDISMITEKGERDYNEDRIGYSCRKDRSVFVLADGLGGHGKGETAASICVDTAIHLLNSEESDAQTFLKLVFESAQQAVLERQQAEHAENQMKSTLVVCYVQGDKISWGHIGDSRLYYFRGGKLLTQTLDHSVPQMLVASGEIRYSQIRHHEDRNRLLRAIGTPVEQLRYEIGGIDWDWLPGDQILLCSDGFWEWIKEGRMAWYLRSSLSARAALKKCEAYLLKKGSGKNMDNYSAILARNSRGGD